MLQPYDIEILPTVFFEVSTQKQKLTSNTTFFRKRANTTDKFNTTLGGTDASLPIPFSHPIETQQSLHQSSSLTIPKQKYDLLLQQNTRKDQTITALQGQVKELREKNEELHRLLGIVGVMEGNQLVQTTRLNGTNQLRSKRIPTK